MAKTTKLWESGATAGNANADYAIPAGSVPFEALYGQVVLTTNATVANRRVIFRILDEDGATVFDVHAGAVVAANSSNYEHEFLQGIYRETSFVASTIQVPLPAHNAIANGWTVRVLIDNGVAGDSFTAKFVFADFN